LGAGSAWTLRLWRPTQRSKPSCAGTLARAAGRCSCARAQRAESTRRRMRTWLAWTPAASKSEAGAADAPTSLFANHPVRAAMQRIAAGTIVAMRQAALAGFRRPSPGNRANAGRRPVRRNRRQRRSQGGEFLGGMDDLPVRDGPDGCGPLDAIFKCSVYSRFDCPGRDHCERSGPIRQYGRFVHVVLPCFPAARLGEAPCARVKAYSMP